MIWPFNRKPKELRNYAMTLLQYVKGSQPVYTKWMVEKAVKEGYRSNGWVYRCVFLISKSAASVPWSVYRDDEPLDGHPLSLLLKKPHPHISRQDLFELIVLWLELAGNSYLKRVMSGSNTAELWPISPDRLKPITPASVEEWCAGFALDNSTTATFQPEEIIHHKFVDPSNPLIGISPLEVAGKAVDCDTAMQNFNVSTSQQRGVVDGVFTFGRSFSSQDEADGVAEKLEEKYGKKRGFIVLGSDAKYQKMALTPVEMDFTESRKFTREEICVVFGVPLPLISQERATYSNYSTAELIFWTMTIVPLLDDICDTFNFSLADELNGEEAIGYDLSNVPAIRTAMKNKLESAKMLAEMGVPFERINRLFDIGIDEYESWDEPQRTSAPVSESRTVLEHRLNSYRLIEQRTGQASVWSKVDRLSEGEYGSAIEDLLEDWRNRVFDALDSGDDVESAIHDMAEKWLKALKDIYLEAAVEFGRKIVVESRSIIDPLTQEIEDYLDHEEFLLTEYGHIEKATVNAVLNTIRTGLSDGLTTADIQAAIIDSGIFEPARALRLSRTVLGTAASLGQHQAATMAGATHKIWDAGPGARKEHAERDGEKVPMDGRFSAKFGAAIGPRYPLDPYMPAADRINCRCAMRFSKEGK